MLTRCLGITLLVTATALGQDKPRPTPEQTADQALAAFKADDAKTLKTLAEVNAVDPWLVADLLCRQDARDAAKAFAAATKPRPDVARLAAWVAARQPDPETDRRIEKARAAIRAKDLAGALAALEKTAPRDPMLAARVHYLRAVALQTLRRHADALRALMEAAAAAERAGWLERAYMSLARAAYNAQMARKAAALPGICERQLRVAEQRAIPRAVAMSLQNLTLAMIMSGNPQRGLQLADRSLAHARKHGDRRGEAYTHLLRNKAFFALGKAAEREAACRASATIAAEIGHARIEADALQDLINTIRQTALPEAQRKIRRRYVDAAARTGNHKRVVEAELSYADYQLETHDVDTAIAAAQRAFATATRHNYPALQAEALAAAGEGLRRKGDLAGAAKALERSLTIGERLRSPEHVLVAANRLGAVMNDLGRYEAALKLFRRGLPLARKLEEHGLFAALKGNMSLSYLGMGSYARSIALQEEAIALREKHGLLWSLGVGHLNLGSLYGRIGDRSRAIEHFERARVLKEKTGDVRGLGILLHNLGALHASGDDQDKAQRYYEQAITVLTKLNDGLSAARARHELAELLRKRGRTDRARKLFEEVLRERTELGDRPGLVRSYVSLAQLAQAERKFDTALGLLEKAMPHATATGGAGPAYALTARARVHLDMENAAPAAADARAAVASLSAFFGGLAESESAGLRDRFAQVFETGVLAGVALDDPDTMAFFLEKSRAGALLESVGARTALQRRSVPEKLLREERGARERVTAAQTTFDAALQTKKRADVRAARTELDAAQRDATAVFQRVRRTMKAAVPLVDPTPVLVPRIGLVTEFVRYAVVDDVAFALISTDTGQRIVKLGPFAPIRDVTRALDRALADKKPTGKLAERARRLLVEPLGLDRARVLVSPASQLAHVPFALLAPDREFAYLPSATTHAVLSNAAAPRGDKVLALGDPSYPQEPGAVTRRAGFERLPHTREEVQKIGDRLLLGADATEKGLRGALGERPRWRAVHLACHGRIDARRPMLSALALTPDGENDGLLSVQDVFRLRVPADLVVLSACETARGAAFDTEGIMGFTHAFMVVGAPRVIVSLWKVDDAATRALMVRFYELWNPKDGSKPLSTATALKTAQDFVSSHEKWKHPYYWAAWQLWGLPS